MPTPNEPGPQVTRLAELPCDRTVSMTREAINVEARTVELSFASEEPYQRWWGIEVLSLDRSAVRLGRLNGGQHPLLVDHRTGDQVGVVQRAWIGDDRRARCIVRFGRSARAEEIFQDVQDGIRSLVSVGYRIHEARLVMTPHIGGVTEAANDRVGVEAAQGIVDLLAGRPVAPSRLINRAAFSANA